MPYDNYDQNWWKGEIGRFMNPVAYAEPLVEATKPLVEATKPLVEARVASYYTNQSVDPRWGGITKSGEKFDETKMTAAVLPELWKELKGKKIRVTNTQNNKSVEVIVNDTGGFKKYGRDIDLSKAAFEKIAPLNQGLTRIKVEVVK